jgi:UDPglucose 6-dehydrogenase
MVRMGMGTDSRIGPSFLFPGVGYGGSCFPKDVQALIRSSHDAGHEPVILNAVEAVNGRQKEVLFHKMSRHFDGKLAGRTVALWGLSFKPNTDDMREAKSLEVVRVLYAAGAQIRAYDPVAMDNARALMPEDVVFCESAYEAAAGADGVALLTEWNEFKYLNLDRLRGLLRRPVIFDARNLYEPERMRRLGFEYYSIGRKPVLAG